MGKVKGNGLENYIISRTTPPKLNKYCLSAKFKSLHSNPIDCRTLDILQLNRVECCSID